jgi:ferredoxin--NADP+ reductase
MNLARDQDSIKAGTIIYKKSLTQELIIIRIQPDGGKVPDFEAGQFITLGLKPRGAAGDGSLVYRAYSIASPPEEKRYFELYIKWILEPVAGKFTSTLVDLKEGDTVFWKKPAGSFTIEEKRIDGSPDTRRLILVAAGTGLAPFISYILHLRARGSRRQIILLHGARFVAELGYRDLLESLASNKENGWDFKYIPAISRPDDPLSSGWIGYTGRVESLLVEKQGESALENIAGEKITPANSIFHVCGYHGTIDAVTSILAPLGFVTNKNKRQDGSFDIKIEIYG